MKNFVMNALEEGRCYMWRQRLTHWTQLIGLMIVVYVGGVGIKSCHNSHQYYHIDRYVVSSTCVNCARWTRTWILKGKLFDDEHSFQCEYCGVGLKGPARE